MTVETSSFGRTPDGQDVTAYTLRNSRGVTVKLIDYGAIIVSVETPDRNGRTANITLGFPDLAGYLGRHPYFGATVGRYANRIAGAAFTLDGRTWRLAANNGPNHLHGGLAGFDKVMWQASVIQTASEAGVRFHRRSPDGEEGYPGNLDVEADYVLTDRDELRVEFRARTDQATPVNLTNHAYWNLSGSGTILDHELMLAADYYLPVDEGLIPTGELRPVAGTPMDFTRPKAIGADIGRLAPAVGYDHCYVLRSQDGSLAPAARVRDPKSGRVLEILTTQPGIQLYTGNFLDGSAQNGGFARYQGLCLETQHYPDSPNRPEFPNTILRPGESYRQVTVHRFLVEE